MAGAHENINFNLNEVPELFDTTISRATITDVDGGSNTCDLNSDKFGTLTDVDIFYHCPGESTVDDGHLAFDIGDQVMLLSKNAASGTINPEHKVVGFWNGVPRLCRPPVLVLEVTEYYSDVLGNPTRWVVLIDPQTGGYQQNVVTDGGTTLTDGDWPVRRSLLDNYFGDLTFQGRMFLNNGTYTPGDGGLVMSIDTRCYSSSDCDSGTLCDVRSCPASDSNSYTDPTGLCGQNWTISGSRSKCCSFQQTDKTFCSYDPPGDDPPYDILESYTRRWEQWWTETRYTCGQGNEFGSWYWDINGYRVGFIEHRTQYQNREGDDNSFWVRDSCNPSADFSPTGCDRYNLIESYVSMVVKTPWGDLWDANDYLNQVDRTYSGSTICPGAPESELTCDVSSCSGFSELWSFPSNNIRNFHVRRVGVIDKVFFAIFGIVYQVERLGSQITQGLYNCDQCSTLDTDDYQDYKKDALCVVGWHPEDDDTFDPTADSVSTAATQAVLDLIAIKYPTLDDPIYFLPITESFLESNFDVEVWK